MSSGWKRLWALAAPWVCAVVMVMASDRASAAGYWETETGTPVNCQGAILKAATPEGVMRAWISWADGCPHDATEHYEYLSCSYTTSNVSWAGSAACWERTYAWWGALDHPFSITKYCPSGTLYSNDAHDCVCPPGQVWDEAPQACVVDYEEISVPYALDPPPPECEVCKGNPIHPLRGVKREVVDTGLVIGKTTLQFTYDNSAKIPKVWTSPPTSSTGERQRYGKLGSLLWFSNLHRSVSLATTRDGAAPTLPNPTVFDRGTGVSRTMTSTATTPPTAEPGNADRFIALAGGGYVYTDSTSNVQETYTSTGQLTAMAWTDGTQVNFSYDGAGMLTQAIDNHGRRLSFAYTAGPEGSTRISTITDANGQVTTLGFDAQSNLASVTWHNGTSKTLLYERTDLPWALTGVRDERGLRYSTFGYDAEGRAISTEHAGGVDKYTVSYTTPPSIRVTEQRDGIYVARTSDWILPQGTLMSEPSGQTTTWSATSLNGKNYFSAQTQPAGAGSLQSSRSQAYDANGNIASRDGFNGIRSCYLNDLARNLKLAEVTGANAEQDCAAVTTANATLPAGALKTSTQWHPDWSLPTRVAEPNRITINVYNGQPDPLNGNAIASCEPGTMPLLDGKPIAVLCKQVKRATTDADGHLGFGAALRAGAIDEVSTWTYDESGRVLTASIGSGASQLLRALATTADHTKGDLLRITAPNGEVTTFDRYNKYGQVLQSTRDGTVTTYTYDLRQRMLSRTVGVMTTAYEYDAAGQLTKVTLANGSWVGYEYDDAHRVVAVADIKGNRIDYVLDNAGNRIDQRLKDPAGELTQSLNALMDALGRQQQAGVTDPAPASNAFPPLPNSPLPLERYEYDAQGNRTKITRGAGTLNLQTRLTYDALERVKDATDARNGKTSFEYDGGHRTTQVTDPRNLVTQYARNGLGDATQVISPDTGVENLSYDAARNLKTRTDSRGVLTTYGYDASDRLTGAVYTQAGQPTETVTLAYSQTGAGFSYGMGRLTSSSHPGGSAQYGYDDQGEVVNDVQRVEASTGSNSIQLTQTVGYGYTLGDLSGIGYPSGRQLGLSWVDGEVTGITLGGAPLITQIEWTPFAGTVKRWRWAMDSGPKANERYFDLAGRAIRYPLGEALRDVRYDEASRIVSFTHQGADGTAQPALDQAFGYDENDRITGITTNAASWAITYDPNGNRTGLSLNGSLSAYTVEATSNRTTSITNPARSFGFDSAGNTTQDSAGYTATYNLRGQLATLTKAGVTTRYTYNAAGQRVRKVSSTGPDSTVVFVYDQAGHLLGEYDRNGAALREYVWLRDTPMAMFTPDPANPSGEPLVYFIHSDHLNTPRVVVDRQNRVRWRWLAEPFGTSAPETNPSGLGVFTQNLRFPGQYADQESGLFYNYHRYYAAEGGRYTQSDPIGLVGGSVSTYAYVNGNPLSFVDPTGLKLPADSDHCKALRDKMGRKNQKLDQRYSEYTMDRGANQLPERVSPTELLSQSRRGHRTLINMEDSSLRKVEQRYAEECEDEPPSPPAVAAGAPEACPAPNAQAAPVTRNILYGVGAAAGATAVMACLAAEPCGLILGVGAAATALAR